MNKIFSQEELALMSHYKAESLYELKEVMQIPHFRDMQSANTTADCIDKLCRMTEKDFSMIKAQIKE